MEYELNSSEIHNPALIRTLLEEVKVTGVCIDETPDSIIFEVPYGTSEVIMRLSAPDHLRDDGRTSREGIEARIEALKAGRGVPHLEQIIAYSLEDEAVVTEIAKGTRASALDPSDLQQITRKQFEDIFDAILLARERSIVIDNSLNNFFYHPEHGFTIIDYEKDDDVLTVEQSLVDFLQGLFESAPRDMSLELRGLWMGVLEKGVEELESRIALSEVSLAKLAGAKQWLQYGVID